MTYTPRGYRRLKNGLLKKSTTTTKRKTTKRKRKQKGKGMLADARKRLPVATTLRQVNSAMKKVNEAKKIFGKKATDAAVRQLAKGKGKVAQLLKGSGLRRAGAGLRRAGVR
jgi:hypothetical protein